MVLGPAESRDRSLGVLVEEEAGRVEPGLFDAFAQVVARPTALVGVPRERPVVDIEPLVVVNARPEGSDGDVR